MTRKNSLKVFFKFFFKYPRIIEADSFNNEIFTGSMIFGELFLSELIPTSLKLEGKKVETI